MTSNTKIEKEEIINIEEIPLIQSLECPIDSMIPLDPVMCSKCQTLFCRSCIDNWKTKSNNCPMRCTPFDTISIEKTIIREQINRIRVRCPYYSYGCTQKIPIPEKLAHETICNYRLTSCTKCRENVSIIFEAEHLKMFCKSNMVDCFLCDQSMNFGCIESHLKECAFFSKSCNICYAIGHDESQCDYAIVQCDKCQLKEMKVMLNRNKHRCLNSKDDGNNVNEYYAQLMARYEYEVQKKMRDKEEKMLSCLNKIKENSNDIMGVIQKQSKIAENKISRIKDSVQMKNEIMVKDINLSITNVKNQIEMIQLEIGKMNKEEMRVNGLQKTIQASFENELNQKTMLKQNETEIQRLFLIQSSKLHTDDKRNDEVIKALLQDKIRSDAVIQVSNEEYQEVKPQQGKISEDKCNRCLKDKNDKRKCSHCNLLICIACSGVCQFNKHAKSTEKENYYCNQCFDSCKFCNSKICNDCRKQCYSSACQNSFCINCYDKNKHQVRGETSSCKIFNCPSCNQNNICIMCTRMHNALRICMDCFNQNSLRK